MLERHCARCHQSGALQQRPTPAGHLANILRIDEIAREAHFVRPGNPDASRLYTMMLARRMPYDIFHEGAAREAPSPDDIDQLRGWIADLKPMHKACPGRPLASADAVQIAVARDLEKQPPDKRKHQRYLSLAAPWNACASEATLEAMTRAARLLLSGLAREGRRIETTSVADGRYLLRIDLEVLQLPSLVWDQLAGLSPYGRAAPAERPSSSPVRIDWLAFTLSEEARKRLDEAPHLSAETRAFVQELTVSQAALARLRSDDAQAFGQRLKLAGLEKVPTFDQLEMVDLLTRTYMRDLSPQVVAAELGADFGTLDAHLQGGSPDVAQLRLRLVQGGIARSHFETLYAPVMAHLRGEAEPNARESIGLATLGRGAKSPARPFELEMIAAQPSYRRDEAASLTVRSEADCHLTLISISPSGRAVVLLPNDWDRNTFLPAGKEQTFPREDSPFRLRLDITGWETIVAGCHPAAPVFDGIQHDFNLEKFTTIGDYRRFLMRVSEGAPMLSPLTAPGEKGAPPRRIGRRDPKTEPDPRKPDPAARTAIRLEVREP